MGGPVCGYVGAGGSVPGGGQYERVHPPLTRRHPPQGRPLYGQVLEGCRPRGTGRGCDWMI